MSQGASCCPSGLASLQVRQHHCMQAALCHAALCRSLAGKTSAPPLSEAQCLHVTTPDSEQEGLGDGRKIDTIPMKRVLCNCRLLLHICDG